MNVNVNYVDEASLRKQPCKIRTKLIECENFLETRGFTVLSSIRHPPPCHRECLLARESIERTRNYYPESGSSEKAKATVACTMNSLWHAPFALQSTGYGDFISFCKRREWGFAWLKEMKLFRSSWRNECKYLPKQWFYPWWFRMKDYAFPWILKNERDGLYFMFMADLVHWECHAMRE